MWIKSEESPGGIDCTAGYSRLTVFWCLFIPEAIKKEQPSPLPRVQSQSGFSGLSPQLSTPPRPSPSPSPHLSTADIITDLGMPEPLMPLNHGRSLRLEEMPISEDVLFQVRPPPGMSHSAKSPQVGAAA